MTDRVFLSMDGLPMTRNSLAGIVGGLKRASGVKRLHARLFRHTFAVKYRMNGGHLVTLQRFWRPRVERVESRQPPSTPRAVDGGTVKRGKLAGLGKCLSTRDVVPVEVRGGGIPSCAPDEQPTAIA